MLALPGGAYIYQGEELTLPEARQIPEDRLSDPRWKMSDYKDRGRDGCRVPLPWKSNSKGAFGFSDNEKLTPNDLINSRNIAGTGTITSEGRVGPIGGIAEKIIGAKRDGVKIFLTPAQNCSDIKDQSQLTNSGGSGEMKIVPVATLTEAISVLNLPGNGKYPSCGAIS